MEKTIIRKFNKRGDVLYRKTNNEEEEIYKYDIIKGNLIYHKTPDNFEEWYEYDNKGNCIHYKNSKGFEEWKKYDNKGREIYTKDSDNYEGWCEYDEIGDLIYMKIKHPDNQIEEINYLNIYDDESLYNKFNLVDKLQDDHPDNTMLYTVELAIQFIKELKALEETEKEEVYMSSRIRHCLEDINTVDETNWQIWCNHFNYRIRLLQG